MNVQYQKLSRILTILCVLTVSFGYSIVSADDSDKLATYHVNIQNLTGGQPFSPPILAVHKKEFRFFKVGRGVTAEIQAIAENGNNGPMVALFTNNRHVHEFQQASAPLVPGSNPSGTGFGNSVQFTVTAKEDAKFISIATMLICTNDGFTGLDRIKMPSRGKEPTNQTPTWSRMASLSTMKSSKSAMTCYQRFMAEPTLWRESPSHG